MPVRTKGIRWRYIRFIDAVVFLFIAGGSSCKICYNDRILLCAGWSFNALPRHSLRPRLLIDGFHWLGSRLLIDSFHWLFSGLLIDGFHWLVSRLLIDGLHWRGSRLLNDGLHWRGVCRRLGSSLIINGFHWRGFFRRLRYRLLTDWIHLHGVCHRLGSRLLIDGFHCPGICRRLLKQGRHCFFLFFCRFAVAFCTGLGRGPYHQFKTPPLVRANFRALAVFSCRLG
jgi:hypothetical protein